MTKSLAPTSYIGMVEVLQKRKKNPQNWVAPWKFQNKKFLGSIAS